MALNDKTKNTYRRVIRALMVVVAALLLVFGLGVPIANNAIAMGVAGELEDVGLPPATTLVESTSLAGRLTNEHGGVQYFGALLIDSDLSLDALQTHYASYTVARQTGQDITLLSKTVDAFRQPVGEGYYIVYALRSGGNAMQWLLDMDTRG